jgi:hypothetical protein
MKRAITLFALAAMLTTASLPVVEAQNRPSPDIPLRVTIDSSPGYNIVSDGRGDYVNGEQGVSAVLQAGGDFLMDPTNSQSPTPRALIFNFSQRIATGDMANPWEGLAVQIDTYLNFDGINLVPVGTVMLKTGGFGQLYHSTSNKSYFNLKFLPDPTAANYAVINTPNVTSYIEVSHPDCNTWILTPQAVSHSGGTGVGAVSGLINIPTSTKGGTVKRVGQYLMPFKITLTRKNPVASCQ